MRLLLLLLVVLLLLVLNRALLKLLLPLLSKCICSMWATQACHSCCIGMWRS